MNIRWAVSISLLSLAMVIAAHHYSQPRPTISPTPSHGHFALVEWTDGSRLPRSSLAVLAGCSLRVGLPRKREKNVFSPKNRLTKSIFSNFFLDTQSDRCVYYIAFAKEQRIRSEPCVQPCCARAACQSGGEAGFGINSYGTSRGNMLEVRL